MSNKYIAVTIAIGLFASLAPAGAQDEASVHKRKGIQYQSNGFLTKAIAEYQKAIEINPSDASSHNNLGLALKDMDLLDDAESELRAAIDLSPKRANYHYNLGIVYARKSNLVGAEKEFRSAIENNTNDSEEHFRLAQVLMLQGKPDDAEKEIKTAIELKPTAPVYSELFGDILLRQIRTQEALTAYKRAAFIRGARKDSQLQNKIEYATYLLTQKDSGKERASSSDSRSY